VTLRNVPLLRLAIPQAASRRRQTEWGVFAIEKTRLASPAGKHGSRPFDIHDMVRSFLREDLKNRAEHGQVENPVKHFSGCFGL
jgi:hypothetical protein